MHTAIATTLISVLGAGLIALFIFQFRTMIAGLNRLGDQIRALEDRFTEQLADFRKEVNERFKDVDKRFKEVNERFKDVDERFKDQGERLARIEATAKDQGERLVRIEAKLDNDPPAEAA